MKRSILAVVAGFVVWVLVVSLLNRGLRLTIAGYTEAEPLMAFTLVMKIARLAMAAVTSLAAGAVTAAIAPPPSRAPWIVGIILVALFIPAHVHFWNVLPVWYHLTFLLTLAPLVAAGGLLLRLRSATTLPAGVERAA